MSNVLAFITALLIALGVMTTIPNDTFASNAVLLQKNQVINQDYFAAGENVTLSGTVNGDAYIAGANVVIEGIVNGDLLVAGGTITVRGKIRDDVRMVGGQINVSGDIGRNISIIGGSVNITDSAIINGNLTAGSGDLSIYAPIEKAINIGAGNVIIGNTIGGNVTGGIGKLSLTPNAKINGDLTYWSENKATLATNDQVLGKITHNIPPKPEKEPNRLESHKITTGVPVFNFISFISALIIGLILIKVTPTHSLLIANQIAQKPLLSFSVGLLSLILAPIIFILLLITILGIPLGFIALAGFLIIIYFAKIFIGLAIGIKTLSLINKKRSLTFAFALGFVIYFFLTLIPFLGFIFWMTAGITGVGAILSVSKSTLGNLKIKKLL